MVLESVSVTRLTTSIKMKLYLFVDRLTLPSTGTMSHVSHENVDVAYINAEKERLRLIEQYRELWWDFYAAEMEIDDNLVPYDQCLASYLGFELAETFGISNAVSLETIIEIYHRHKAILEAAQHNLNIARVKHLRRLVQEYLDTNPKKNPHYECDEKCYYVSVSGNWLSTLWTTTLGETSIVKYVNLLDIFLFTLHKLDIFDTISEICQIAVTHSLVNLPRI